MADGLSCPPLDLLFLAAPLPISLSRRSDGRLLAVNDAWVRFSGIDRDQALGQTTVALGCWIVPQVRQRYLASLDAGEKLFTLTAFGAQRRRVRLSSTCLVHEGEQLLLVSLEDITREFEAEQRLVDTNRRLQQQVELHEATEKLASVGHWTNAEEEEHVIWSPGLFALTGQTPRDPMTRSQARVVVHEDDMPAWLEARQALDGRLLEFRLRMPDGSIRWARSRMSRTSIQGNPETDFGVVQDITAEKLALDALEGQAGFIRSIAARVPGIIYQARLRPDGSSEIPFVNDAVRDMLELEPEVLRHDARPLFGRVHPEDLPGLQAALQASACDLVPWRQMYRAVLPRGGVRWYRVEAVPQREPDGSVLWHGFTTDVTESHLASQKLQRQHRMLEAIQTAQALFIEARDRREAFDGLLAAFLSVTASEYGFIGEVLYDEARQPYLKTYAMTDIAWDETSRGLYAQHDQSGVEFRNLESLFGHALATGQPLVSNNPSRDPRSAGMPAGHRPMNAFLGVPLALDGELVAMVALANQPGGYAQADIEFLQPLLGAVRQLVVAWRQQVEQAHTREQLEATSAELARQSETLRITLDSMAQGISQVDASRHTIVYNQRLLELLDLPEALLASRPTHEAIVAFQSARGDFGDNLSLVDDPLARKYIARYAHLGAAEAPDRYLRRTRDGRTLEIRTRALANGGMVRTYSDVTPFVHAQDALHQERQRLSWVLEATRPGIWELDVASGALVINSRWAEMLGHAVDELGPLNFETWRSRVHPDDLGSVLRMLDLHLAGNTDFYECDFRMRHREGRWVWINTRGRVHRRDDQGRPLYMSGTHLDVTERVLAQEEVRALNATLEQRVRERTEALERSMRDMETISYSIAHDLRAPLRAVNGFASLIADEGEELGPVTRDMFLRISRASRNMGQMITDMLELLRVVRVELSTVPVDLALVAHRAAESLAPGIAQSDLVCGNMPRVMGDATLLRQVLANLLDNAIKYARPGERPSVELGFDPREGAFYLRDSGVGFDMSRADKLFGLFQRMHIASDVPGTGVGLAIVARIIERHGGRIWASSKPGEGTTFWWTLPTV